MATRMLPWSSDLAPNIERQGSQLVGLVVK